MTAAEATYPFADLSLARRLEKTEGRGCREFVEARARLAPQSGARAIEVAGTDVMYDGVRSPITQTFGLGMSQEATAADLEKIEAFYHTYGAPVDHEVSPLAGVPLLALLCERGYRPIELTSVMFRPTQRAGATAAPRNPRIGVRLIQDHEQDLWGQTAARGWADSTEFIDVMQELMRVAVQRPESLSFLAEIDGRPIATAGLVVWQGVALFAGASTLPEERKQGAQRALLDARLRYAAEHGCDLAMMCAAPGSISQRNAERQGFRIAYTRTKWRLQPTTETAL
jgi:GNAT superfamily N-acetyltransferase